VDGRCKWGKKRWGSKHGVELEEAGDLDVEGLRRDGSGGCVDEGEGG